jgi:hypothetical protein
MKVNITKKELKTIILAISDWETNCDGASDTYCKEAMQNIKILYGLISKYKKEFKRKLGSL